MKISTTSRNFILLLVLTGLSLSACEKIEPGKEFTVRLGEDKKVNLHLSFKIDSLWDSRCPANMYCFSSGDVNLFFNIKHSNHHFGKAVSFYENENHPFSYDGYLWKILEVNPYPSGSEKSDPMDYAIKMVITKD